MKTSATLILLTLFGFTATAFASAPLTADDTSLLEYARPMFDAIVHGNYWLAAAAALMLACAGVRKYQPASWKTGIKGDIVGTATAFALAFAGALFTWLAAPGAAMTAALAYAALKVGMAAIFGYTTLHKLGTALAASKWFQLKAPAWLQAAVAFALKLIGSNAITKAEAAGKSAVEAKPSAGASPGNFEQF